MRSAYNASSNMWDLGGIKRGITRKSSRFRLLCLKAPLFPLSLSEGLFSTGMVSTLTLFLNSLNSFNFMNFEACCLNSSKLSSRVKHKSSTKHIAWALWPYDVRPTSRFKFLIFRVTLLNCSLKVHNDSSFSCLVLTSAKEVRW